MASLRLAFLFLFLTSCADTPSLREDPRSFIPIPLFFQGESHPLLKTFCMEWGKGREEFQFPETYRSPCASLDGFLSPYSSLLIPLQGGEVVTGATLISEQGSIYPLELLPFLAKNHQPFVELLPLKPLPSGEQVFFLLYGNLHPRPWGRCFGPCPPGVTPRSLAFSAFITDEITPFLRLILSLPPALPLTVRPLNLHLPQGRALLMELKLLDYRLPDEAGGTIMEEARHPVTMPLWILLPSSSPPKGWVLFVHGLGGDPSSFLSYYPRLLARGYGALGIYQLRHPFRHDLKGSGFQVGIVNSFFNLANLPMMRDNLRQMILDLRQTILALPEIHRFLDFPSPSTLAVGYVGESLGCLVGGGAYGMIPEIRGAACLVGGSRLYRLFTDSPAGALFGSLEIPLGGFFKGWEWTPFLRAIGPRSLDGGDPGVLGSYGSKIFPGRIFRLYLAHKEALMPNSASLDLILALDLPRLGAAPPPWDTFPEGDPLGSGFRVGVYPELSPPKRHGAVKDDPVFVEEILRSVIPF